MNKKWLWKGIIFGLLATQLSACDPGEAEDSENEKPDPAVPVETAAASRDDISAVYAGTASIEAEAQAEVVAKVAGEVIEILVEEGDRVEKDQVLARLDGDRLRLQLREMKANRDKLEQDYERQLRLLERGLLSTEAAETLKYDLEAIRASYALAQLEYSYTEIRAPLDGVVAERLIKVGNTIQVNTPTFRISDNDPLIAYLHVPEKDYNKIGKDQPAKVVIDALGNSQFEAKVLRISPTVDAATGTFKATMEMIDPNGKLRPGMFGRFAVVYDNRPDALLIPRAALLDSGSGPIVFVVEDGTAIRKDVEIGFTNNDRVEILAGLTDGDEVVTIGQAGLKDGSQVEVIAPAEIG